MEKVWNKRFRKFVWKLGGIFFFWNISLKICLRNKVEKLCRTFGGKIVWIKFDGKIGRKVGWKIFWKNCVEQLGGKIYWTWVNKLIGNLYLKKMCRLVV